MTTNKAKYRTTRTRELDSMRGKTGGRAKLTGRRLLFVDEYLKDRDAKRAARAAGYSDSYAEKKAYALLRIQAIADEVDRRTLMRIKRLDIQVDDIILELKRIALFDVRKLFDPTTGRFKANPYEMSDDDARGLVNFDVCVLDRAGDYIVKLVPGAKLRALELLGRHIGMFSDRSKHSGTHTITFTTDYGESM